MTSGRFRRVRALTRKETLQILRDPSSVLIAFVLPLILLFFFGYGISLDIRGLHIGLVIEEADATASSLADGFRGSSFFIVGEGRDRREFRDALVSGRIRGIVVIPARFSRDLAEGGGASVQILVDGTDPNTAKFVQNYAQGVVAAWESLLRADAGGGGDAPAPRLAIEQRFWFNPELTSRYFLVPGAIAVVMTVIGTLLTSLVIAREWERGTMEALMATPATAGELLLGKFIPYFLLGMLAMTVCLLAAVFLFGVPFRGSLFALYALSAAFLLPALGLGLLISAGAKNQFLAAQIGLLAGFLPSYLLSGFIFEIASMPWPIRLITLIVPARHLVPSLQTVLLAGDVWAMFLPAMAVMLGMGGFLMFVVFVKTKKRIG